MNKYFQIFKYQLHFGIMCIGISHNHSHVLYYPWFQLIQWFLKHIIRQKLCIINIDVEYIIVFSSPNFLLDFQNNICTVLKKIYQRAGDYQGIFIKLAHWADSIQQSRCPSVSVLSPFHVLDFEAYFAPPSQSWMSKLF